MQMIRTLERTGKSGTLLLRIPLTRPETECEVIVVVQPTETTATATTPEDRGWPAGFFERTAGRWQGDFVCEPAGDFEGREPL